jgi:hypothetical protein
VLHRASFSSAAGLGGAAALGGSADPSAAAGPTIDLVCSCLIQHDHDKFSRLGAEHGSLLGVNLLRGVR